VLAAMRSALAAKGYAAVTIEGLAADAGVAKQTIYRWWPSKAEILGEALLEGTLPGSDVEVPFTDDLATDLRTWFTATSAALSDPEGSTIARALIAVVAKKPELGEQLTKSLVEPIRNWVIRRLQVATDAGEVSVGADVIADQFVAIAAFEALIGRPLEPAWIEETVRVMLRGIARG
jgi:AcrR family transcriptional regulator